MTIKLTVREMMQIMKLRSPAPIQSRLVHLNRKLAAHGIQIELA